MFPLTLIRKELEASGLRLRVTKGGVLLTGPDDVLSNLTADDPQLPPLTPQQEKVLDAIRTLMAKNNGMPPSVREIGEAVGLSSSSTVHGHIVRLREKGYVMYGDGFRRLQLLA